MSEDLTTPEWARWPEPHELGEYTIGIEEEVMLLTAGNFALANRINAVMPMAIIALCPEFNAASEV